MVEPVGLSAIRKTHCKITLSPSREHVVTHTHTHPILSLRIYTPPLCSSTSHSLSQLRERVQSHCRLLLLLGVWLCFFIFSPLSISRLVIDG
ncbi:hypothetical protein RJT34_03184 [Clitoria ternatea]|uniref:Transmembrane protein n=1 Tax=Clitoria ternatea TaxID=43366 RepID=A0AAN9Q1I9_CLITE